MSRVTEGERVSDGARRRPTARLRPYLASYDGYRLAGFDAGSHIGMPSAYLTVIVSIDSILKISDSPKQGACAFETLASGISAAPVTIDHDGSQHGIQLSLTPLGARALFGVPAAALGDWMVDLHDVLPCARELVERVTATPDWDGRFDLLDECLSRSFGDVNIDPTLTQAWALLVDGCESVRVGDVARQIGWSRRHLINRFSAEFGVGPKDAARIARFDRSHRMLRRAVVPTMADVAARCGYYDQAHMARDWRDLAGASPSQWRRDEKFAFVQDDDDFRTKNGSHD